RSLSDMVAIYVLSTRGHRTTALIAALCAVAASLVWVANRAAPAVDPGVSTLIWVAFGTVLGVFFLAPFMAGEIVRLRRAARHLARVQRAAGSPAWGWCACSWLRPELQVWRPGGWETSDRK